MTWTVDYGEGPRPVELPHAWRQDVPVSWEGPAVYRTSIEVQHDDDWLEFGGVSYMAAVFLDGKSVLEHCGIWDSFAVPLGSYAGSSVKVEVHVTKNGGERFPVKDALSGFLPFVYHTFGGLYGGVRIVRSKADPTSALKPMLAPRVNVRENKILVDGELFYLRGVLSWGWYPELGHMNPSDDEIRSEVRTAKKLGFNSIKFCLWVPRRRFFEILEEEGMFAWLELPLWDPTSDHDLQDEMEREIETIVKQYRHHRSIIAWTVGCELSSSTDHEFRKRLVEMVQRETGCPLVKDNSGGAEMYGGDLREFGTFDDFHPYCDTHFYPTVLETLRTGPRTKRPVLLGEFNDFDVHRDLGELKEKSPFWVSTESDLNDKGVRWKQDLPGVLQNDRMTARDNSTLIESSIAKGAWVRHKVMEHVRSMDEVAGYVVTGWRHTPISTSGMVDDDLEPVYQQRDTDKWNSDKMLFLIPTRRPPWVNGGNRPGWRDAQCFFTGQVFCRVGCHATEAAQGALSWQLASECGLCAEVVVHACSPKEIGQFSVDLNEPSEYLLQVEYGTTQAEWPIWVVERPDWTRFEDWEKNDPLGLLEGVELPGGNNLLTTVLDVRAINRAKEGATVIALITTEGTLPTPFWRECAFDFQTGRLDFLEGSYERLWGLSTDRVIDPGWLKEKLCDYETVINRVDTRTYEEHAYAITARIGKGKLFATTLRPFGMQGCQPWGVDRNPTGAEFLKRIIDGDW